MVAVDPYRRWRKAVYLAGVAVVGLLTLAVLVLLLIFLVGLFTNGRSG